MTTSGSSSKPRLAPVRHQFVVRGWLGHSDFPLKTVNLSVQGALVRHEAAPPAPGTAACLRLSLLMGESVQLVDVPVVVRESVVSRGAYLTDLDFVKPASTVKVTLEQVLRGRPQVA